MKKYGKVYLIGAGPGDKGLLTVKATQILREADVVVYDRLVGKEILKMIPEKAEKINAGKNPGNHPLPQEEINRILFEKACECDVVVRLKGGDPFLFGRGGEELELLYEKGVEFEVVPGVTSAVSAPAYAGIPVTHRDFCSSLHIITGHGRQNAAVTIDYSSLVNLRGTLVFMMSVASAPVITGGLISGGMDKNTAAAVIENGTRGNQRSFTGTLENIVDIIKDNNIKPPSIIVVGNVCSLADKFDWFSRLPLKGCRVGVTRSVDMSVSAVQKDSGRLLTTLSRLGADTVDMKCVSYVPTGADIAYKDYSWLIFNNPAAVNIFFDSLKGDARELHGKKVAVRWVQAKNALLRHGIKADFISSQGDELTLLSELVNGGFIKDKEKAVFYGSSIEYEAIKGQTDKLELDCCPLYELSPIVCEDPREFDFITFSTVNCVEGVARQYGKAVLESVKAVCIGERTSEAAGKYGMRVYTADEKSLDSMAELIVKKYKKIK